MTPKTDSTAEGSPTPNPTVALALHSAGLGFQWQKSQPLLRYPDIHLPVGEHLFLRGPSGSGKSTLMSLMGGLVVPTEGSLRVLETDLSTLSGGQRDRFRANYIGVIFQQFNLVPYLNPLGNVQLPCRLSHQRREKALPTMGDAARSLLRALDIPDTLWQRPVTQLSVGQQQRVAAARALIGAPELILADEPTSALDTNNRDRFIELLLGLAAEQGASVVFVSHDQSLASRFDHQLALEVFP